MLAAFLPPYPFRAQPAPYLWCYYRLLCEWANESAFFITGQDYVCDPVRWQGRWECDPVVQSRLGYCIPQVAKPAQHHYAWLDGHRFDEWLTRADANPIEAFRQFLCERDDAFETELVQLIDAAPEPLEAIVTICNVPSLEAVCAQRGIPVVHIELGALRGPLYRETGYVDFRGVNGNTEAALRYQAFDGYLPHFSPLDLLKFFLIHPETHADLPTQHSHECGVVMQVEDDSNLVAFGNGMSNLSLLAAAKQQIDNHDLLLVRPHPGSPFSIKLEQSSLDASSNSLIFVARCQRILTINSSVGLEALLLNKPLTVWGQNSYNFVLEANDDAEKNKRLNFYLFAYLVPFSLQLKPSYLRFRLGNPKEQDIIFSHVSEYMQQEHLDPELFSDLPLEFKNAVSIRYSQLVHQHQSEIRAWQDRNHELERRISEQQHLHIEHTSNYEQEIARINQESLSMAAEIASISAQLGTALNTVRAEQLQQRQKDEHFETWQKMVVTSWSWRLTLPLRVAGRLMRGEITVLRDAWRRVCREGGRRGMMARKMNGVLRTALILCRNPNLLIKGMQSLRQHGVRFTLQRMQHVLGKQTWHADPYQISIGGDGAVGVVILTTPHCRYLAELMKASLSKVNMTADIIYQMPDRGYRDLLHIVICPQMFSVLPGQYIAYQLEQSVSSRWFTDEYISSLERSVAIFDYSLRNISFLQEKGLSYRQIYHLPVGLLQQEPVSPVTETVDVLFYGDINNDRRRAYIAELKKYFSVKIINDLFGEALYAEMAKAKVIVNIHYYEGALLETTRIYECLSQNKIVVSEESSDMDEHSGLLPLVDFVPVNDIQAMVEKVNYWVCNDVERIARNKDLRNICSEMPDMFSYYFLRLFLAHDLITYDDFYQAVGEVINFNTDKICLGLPETTARKADFDKDNHYDIQYFPGLRHQLGWVGCGLSYKFLINRAKDLKLNQILICEDDVAFPDDFSIRLERIQKYLSRKDNWDVFSGLIADLHDDVKILHVEDDDSERYVTIDKMVSMVTNIYSDRFYNKLLAWDSRNHDAQVNTIDRFIEQHENVQTIVTSRYLVGHKEDLNSTLWGISNITYKNLIQSSEGKLKNKTEEYIAN